jgi:hypothetical protein
MKLNKLFKTFGLIALISTIGALEAKANCQVYIDKVVPCKGSPVPLQKLFKDRDGLANISPRRCTARAYEYHAYCGYDNSVAVFTYFHNGVNYSTAAGNWGDSKWNTIYGLDKNGEFNYLGNQRR